MSDMIFSVGDPTCQRALRKLFRRTIMVGGRRGSTPSAFE
jgi:hypothetical protein